MGTRPTLTLEAEAAIEQTRQKIFESAELQFQLLFFKLELPGHSLAGLFSDRKIVPRQRMAATVKIQLRDYFYGLFDAEAEHYARCQSTEAELRTWLENLGKRIMAEVEKLAIDERHNFHCNLQERMEAISNASTDRIEHWIKIRPTLILARILRRETPAAPITPLRGTHAWKPIESTSPGMPQIEVGAPAKTVGERLDDARLEADISHEEQASRIGISRTTYFDVKAGRGGRKARKKVGLYLKGLQSTNSNTKPD